MGRHGETEPKVGAGVLRGWLERYWAALLAPGAGLLLSLGYAPHDLAWVAWVSPALLCAACWYGVGEGARPVRRGFRLGLLWGLGFSLPCFFWLTYLHEVVGPLMCDGPMASWMARGVGLLAWVLLAGYVSLYGGLLGAFLAGPGRLRAERLRPGAGGLFLGSGECLRVAVLAGLGWVGVEWLRGTVFGGFGWNGLGVALHDSLVIAQLADLLGVAGLTFLVAAVSVVGLVTLHRFRLEAGGGRLRPHLDVAVTVAVVICVFFYGSGKLAQPVGGSGEVRHLNVLVVQTAVPLDLTWAQETLIEHYEVLDELTRDMLESVPLDLVVWPESALPLVFYDPYHIDFLDSLLELQDCVVMAGAQVGDFGAEGFYNSVALLRGEFGRHEFYHKHHLVPFGEFFPLRELVPGLDALAATFIPQDFRSGDRPVGIELGGTGVEVVPLVCFEDTLEHLARGAVVGGRAQVLVNLTNDGWFGASAAAEQHLANARFRAIEVRRPLIRSANTGVSAVVDEVGSLYDRSLHGGGRRVVDVLPGGLHGRGRMLVTVHVPAEGELTWFVRGGYLFAPLVTFGVGLWWLVWAVVGWRMPRRGAGVRGEG
jgi:apolipoprotein N-acyltransferase